MTQPLKVVFAPGALESLEDEMSPEELQLVLDEIKAKLEDGTLFEESTPVDFERMKTEDPELYKTLMERLEEIDIDNIEPPQMN